MTMFHLLSTLRSYVILLPASLLFFCCHSASADDFSLSSGASAALEEADCPPKAAVLMIHGWAGQKDEVGDIYKILAKQLAEHCIISLRFDVQGESEREKSNYTLTSTFASRVQDAQSGLDYLQTHYPNTPLIVLGFSLGGATAMELVSQHPDTFFAMVLWSSAINPSAIATDTVNFTTIRQAVSEGKGLMKSWADFTLTREHIVGMLGYNPLRNLGQFKGHILSIRGSDDFLPAYEDKIFTASNAVTEDAYYLGGADHIFHVFEPDKSQKAKVLRLTQQWIAMVLDN
ncbi:alpha/beta hydrolase [Alteromonas sp. 14N.309.X.WAT.G.H12]|uniref:alpha/beta hydrolase n=1 Tax=Alteromonas sp. 14N.309.X.WAT.G.H12 TaxID=3120824 RepID=UPI002FD5BC1A